ncbi:MAG: hypothetical protein WBX22_19720 [Silvibacterium sp.]|jgi:hypothetical protein
MHRPRDLGVFAGVPALEALFAEDVVSYSDGGGLASQEEIYLEEIEEELRVILESDDRADLVCIEVLMSSLLARA